MKAGIKIVAIAFTALLTIFAFYQLAVGNPFKDDISPVIITFCFLGMAVIGLIAIFRKKKA